MTHRPPRLLVINQYYEPDVASTGVLLAALCEDLARDGADVDVLAGQPSYTSEASDAPQRESRNGVEVSRLRMGKHTGRESMWIRVSGYLRFIMGARKLGRRLASEKQVDIIVTGSNPPLLERVGSRIARKTKAKHVHIIYDIHPDAVVAAGIIQLPRFLAKLWNRLSITALAKADRLVVPSADMKDYLVQAKKLPSDHISIINLWAIPELTTLPDPEGVKERYGIPKHHLVVAHTGNIGIIHGLERVIEAAALVEDLPVTFMITGDGAARLTLERLTSRLGVENVVFTGYVPNEEFVKLLAAADISLVTLKDGMERFSIPSKAYTYLSAGKPLLALLGTDNDVTRMIEDHQVGWRSTNAGGLAETLRMLAADRSPIQEAGARAAELYRSTYSRDAAVRSFRELFTSVAASRHQPD